MLYVVLKNSKMDEVTFLASKVFCECLQCDDCPNCEVCFQKRCSCCRHDFSDVIRGADRTHDSSNAPKRPDLRNPFL